MQILCEKIKSFEKPILLKNLLNGRAEPWNWKSFVIFKDIK